MKQLKNLLIYNLIIVMIFGLAACGTKQEAKTNPIVSQKTDLSMEEESQQIEQENAPRNIDELISEIHKDPSRDIKAYLFLGIDRSGTASDIGYLNGGGQCDTIFVVAVDNDNKSYKLMQLNRDTYTDIVIPDVYGNAFSTEKSWLALSYAYGSGMQDSCINAERSVSKLLHGLEFDGYIALYYDAIAPIVDAIDGVDITIEEDLSSLNENFIKGNSVHMNGEDAYKFCRARMSVGDGKNTSRMRRQRSFLNAFVEASRKKIDEKSGIINEMYKLASPYMISDLSQGEICEIALKALKYKDCGIVVPRGTESSMTAEDGNTYNVFTVNDDDLQKILKNLYN